MADVYEVDYGTAYYRSRDPIRNFKLRVKLKRATTTTAVPQLAISAQKDAVELQQMKDSMMQANDDEVYEFGWQEKVFSEREVENYSDLGNCVTVLERKYHNDVLPMKDKGRPTKRLFSYVDHDIFTNCAKCTKQFTNSSTEQQTQLALKMETVRHRRNAANGRSDKKTKYVINANNVINNDPSEEQKKNNRLVSGATQTMYIMANLAPASRPGTEDDEVILCSLKIDANGVLSIKPDFSKGRQPYRAGGGKSLDGRELVLFTLEHASCILSRKEQEKEFKMYKEMYSRHADFIAVCVGQGFEMPPPDVLRVMFLGEIVQAKDFEYDNLYIHWFIDLPTGWVPTYSQPLSGVTQTTATTVKGRSDVAYFSYPFNFDLLYTGGVHEKQEMMPRWPQLYFEVLSWDWWQRYRTEGYGYVLLPQAPGIPASLLRRPQSVLNAPAMTITCLPRAEHMSTTLADLHWLRAADALSLKYSLAGLLTQTIHCWRPVGRSRVSEMRRFFIGGSPELEDPTYVASPSAFELTKGKSLLFVKLRELADLLETSRSSFLHSVASKQKNAKSLIEKIGFSTAATSILNVLDAFQKAKHRMIAARENLKKEFVKTLGTFEYDDEEEETEA